MQGTIRPQDATFFKALLTEGKTYVISNFLLSINRRGYRAVPSELILRFGRNTSIVQLAEDEMSILIHKFHLLDYSEALDPENKHLYLTGLSF